MTAFPRAERRARKTADKKEKPYPWCMGEVVFVPCYTLPSLANARLHWRTLAKIKKEQRQLGAMMARLHHRFAMPATVAPCTVTLTRQGKRDLDDDNLASAFKHVRDGIAAALGVDDGPAGPITWRYAQERTKGDPAITMTVTQ